MLACTFWPTSRLNVAKCAEMRLNAAKWDHMQLHAAKWISNRKPWRKLHGYRSQLYEQLGNRPKQHFSQKNKLYTIPTSNLAPALKNKEKKRGAKSARLRAPNPRINNITLESLTLEEKREGRKASLHAELHFRGPLKAHSYPVSSPVFKTILVFPPAAHMAHNEPSPAPYCFS